MRSPSLPPAVHLVILGLFLALPIASATAQATRDESRLVIGVATGYIAGSDLWTVARQPILSNSGSNDVFRLSRRIRPNFAIVGQATWYSRGNLGFTGELSYLGLGTVDGCGLVEASGSLLNRLACDAIDEFEHPASVVGLGGGVVFRPASRAFLQPYLRGVGGIAIAPRSTVKMVGAIGVVGDSIFTIYPESRGSDARLSGSISIGVATPATAGYQLHLEFRNNWVQLPIVTGPSQYQGIVPPTKSVWKALPSFLVGFDVVLEKRRGRRY